MTQIYKYSTVCQKMKLVPLATFLNGLFIMRQVTFACWLGRPSVVDAIPGVRIAPHMVFTPVSAMSVSATLEESTAWMSVPRTTMLMKMFTYALQ